MIDTGRLLRMSQGRLLQVQDANVRQLRFVSRGYSAAIAGVVVSLLCIGSVCYMRWVLSDGHANGQLSLLDGGLLAVATLSALVFIINVRREVDLTFDTDARTFKYVMKSLTSHSSKKGDIENIEAIALHEEKWSGRPARYAMAVYFKGDLVLPCFLHIDARFFSASGSKQLMDPTRGEYLQMASNLGAKLGVPVLSIDTQFKQVDVAVAIAQEKKQERTT